MPNMSVALIQETIILTEVRFGYPLHRLHQFEADAGKFDGSGLGALDVEDGFGAVAFELCSSVSAESHASIRASRNTRSVSLFHSPALKKNLARLCSTPGPSRESPRPSFSLR